jgi:Mannosyltransferase (PIG-V)
MSKESSPLPSFCEDDLNRFHQSPQQNRWHQFIFVLAMWFLSRLLIVFIMQVVAPMLQITPNDEIPVPFQRPSDFVPTPGWELFTHWDGKWYGAIATNGYEFGQDYSTQRYTIAFPPFYPLIAWVVMQVGLPFEIAGTLVNNLAFLGALLVLYDWVEEQYSPSIAKWATIVLAWCPYSLYGTTAYTEGLFLLTTTAALRSFDKQHYKWAGFWGALATATRIFGVALIPTFWLVAWKKKRPPIAYLAGLAVTAGWLIFLAYGAFKFGDPWVTFRAQASWFVDQENWKNVIGQVFFKHLISIERVTKFVMFFGGAVVVWLLRKKLHLLAFIYAFCYLGVLIGSGSTFEISRYSYGNIVWSIAGGILLSRYKHLRYPVLSIFVMGIVYLTIRFTWWYFAL